LPRVLIKSVGDNDGVVDEKPPNFKLGIASTDTHMEILPIDCNHYSYKAFNAAIPNMDVVYAVPWKVRLHSKNQIVVLSNNLVTVVNTISFPLNILN